MDAKKFQHLFSKRPKKKPVIREVMLASKRNGAKKQNPVTSRNTDKKIAENLIRSINSKLKDPELAKKAALVIEEMIKEQGGRIK